MKSKLKLIGIAVVIAMFGFSMTGCPTDVADTGTFRVRITDIPLSYFNVANGPTGRFEIGLFPARQAPSMENLIGGSDMWGSSDFSGTALNSGWIEFYFYYIGGDRIIGPSGNYDIGIQMFGPGNTLRYVGVLINVRLEVDRVNTVSFTTFGPPQPPEGTLAEQLAWLRTNAQSGGNHTITISRDESLTPAQAELPSGRNNLTITLRGDGTIRTVSLAENGSLFDVDSGVTLVLDNNVTLRGRTGNDNSLIHVRTGGTLVMNTGAIITGNTETSTVNTWGGGVMLWDGGTFTMNGGEITNNSANAGGGVQAQGTFVMRGGTISDNTARTAGGGVNAARGVFVIHNGTISGNTATGPSLVAAGGVLVGGDGIFTMYNGRIFDNTAHSSAAGAWGGGISVGGTFTMHGGEIFDNTATGTTWGQAGGVLVNSYAGGLFDMRDGVISGNVTVSNGVGWANGGGVFVCGYNAVGGTFLMSGGAILYDNVIRHTGNMSGSNVALTVGTHGANSATAQFGTIIGDSFSRRGDLTTTNSTVRVVNGVLQ